MPYAINEFVDWTVESVPLKIYSQSFPDGSIFQWGVDFMWFRIFRDKWGEEWAFILPPDRVVAYSNEGNAGIFKCRIM